MYPHPAPPQQYDKQNGTRQRATYLTPTIKSAKSDIAIVPEPWLQSGYTGPVSVFIHPYPSLSRPAPTIYLTQVQENNSSP